MPLILDAEVRNRIAVKCALAFALPAFLLASAIVACTWIMASELLPMKGESWIDATYPFTAMLFAGLCAYVAFNFAGLGARGPFAAAAAGASIAFASFYLTCVHAGAVLLWHRGYAYWWIDALGAGFWSYMFWSFLGLWGIGIPILGASIGWRTRALMTGPHSTNC